MFGLILAIACMVIWGLTDIFDKKGSPREDPLACYKFMVWQGIISSILVIALAPMSETGILLPAQLRKNAVYILISMAYPISIMFGLNGMRYLDASIASPLENIDGMIAPIFMLIYFLATGTIESIGSVLSVWNFIGVALVITGVILIGKVEQELADQDGELRNHLLGGRRRPPDGERIADQQHQRTGNLKGIHQPAGGKHLPPASLFPQGTQQQHQHNMHFASGRKGTILQQLIGQLIPAQERAR